MRISSIHIQNFKKLYRCKIDFSKDTTLFVGANNSGKTSAMDALGKFLAGRPFVFNDFTISNRELINKIGAQWEITDCEKPESISNWSNLLPAMDVWLDVASQDIHHVVSIIPTLDWRGGLLGVRLLFQPQKIETLFTEYREAFFAARETEKKNPGKEAIQLFPKNLCDFLERKLSTYFTIKSYILDPSKAADPSPQETVFEMECLTDNPLKGIVRINMISAQRGFSDTDKKEISEVERTSLSSQIRGYYDKHLDPEKTPSPEDLSILVATEQARKVFDQNLETKFEPAIKELEELGYGETKVAFIGVATPESPTKSTPTYFMEDGEYVYNFAQGNNGQNLYDCVQGYVDECEAQGADYVILLAHLGDAEESAPYTSPELIAATDGIDVVLDAHAHSVIAGKTVENKAGEPVLLSSTGTKLANIGKLVIRADGEITTELICGYSAKDAEMDAYIRNVKAQYETEMNKVIATSDIALTCKTEDGIRLVRNRETAIGDLCADAYRAIGGADIGVVNGGGIRADIPKGDITYANMLAVHPYGNTLCVVRATGQEIIDLLETACMYTQAEISKDGNAVGENGGFMQVSGLKFTIDTSIPSSVVLDELDNFVSVSGERRVKDVTVLDDNGAYVPIEFDAVYTVASHNYLLKAGGDSFTGFMDNEFIISEGICDYQVLTQYITEVLNGKLGELYSAPQGRITIK